MNPSNLKSKDFKLAFSQTLKDYVTGIVWSGDGSTLAVTSAVGEVVLYQDNSLTTLQEGNNHSIDCIDFSHDGLFLATGGQDGKVRIWQNNRQDNRQNNNLIATLENTPAWIDKLVWNPVNHQLAFGVGKQLQVWDADSHEIVAKLNFANSSILGIDWRFDGRYIAASGHRGIKVWDGQNWDKEPFILDIPSATIVMGWSSDGKYLASSNMDRTITLVETESLLSGQELEPWVMRGFPGKIRRLDWSKVNTSAGTPLLATTSVDGIVVWDKSDDENVGWEAQVLTNHVDIVQAIAFAPNSLDLASAGSDQWLCVWENAKQVSQIITGVDAAFSCVSWHPQGDKIAAGSVAGELRVWEKPVVTVNN
ncbi:MAG: WD40 repeat domain-containing protein [Mastigocoleus sp.]